MQNHFCMASNDKKPTVPQQKSDITTLKFKSKIQFQKGAHILWKVHSRFVCMLARIGPRMRSVPAKAETISASVCAQVPGWASEQSRALVTHALKYLPTAPARRCSHYKHSVSYYLAHLPPMLCKFYCK